MAIDNCATTVNVLLPTISCTGIGATNISARDIEVNFGVDGNDFPAGYTIEITDASTGVFVNGISGSVTAPQSVIQILNVSYDGNFNVQIEIIGASG